MTQQTKEKLREEFGQWLFDNKVVAEDCDDTAITDFWLAKLEALVRDVEKQNYQSITTPPRVILV